MNAPDLAGHGPDLASFLPFDPAELGDHQKALPAIAKDAKRIAAIEEAVSRIPTTHALYNSDARRMAFLKPRSEEHTSELQSRQYLVCRLLLEKKKKQN